MTDFKAIETFMWVVTLGSFRGAAHKLNTTQPAISQRIAQLERAVGVKLLQRDRRMVLPTPSGRQMMVYAEKLIGLRSEMLAAIGDRSAINPPYRGWAVPSSPGWSSLQQSPIRSTSTPAYGYDNV